MKNLLFIAPPAGGKGTISEKLVEEYGYVHISTGDLLRELDKSTPLGKEVDALLKTGKFIDDELVLKLLKEKLESIDGQPFILDGCPRNLTQAKAIETMFDDMGLSLDCVIELEVPYDVVLKRAIGRVSCPKCKATFNTFFKKPLKGDVCDKCGEMLVHRTDDNEDTFKVRYETYINETTPIIDFYKERGKYVGVDGIDDTYEAVVSVIQE